MAGYGPLQQITKTLIAAADYSAKQNRLVRFSGLYAVLCTLRSQVNGVLLNKPVANAPAEVCIFGLCEVKTNGSIAQNDYIMPDNSGYASTATLGTGTGVNIIGKAMELDGGAGSLVQAFICNMQGQL